MAAGGTVGAAMFGMFSMSSVAVAGLSITAAVVNFAGGVGGYLLHANGQGNTYNFGLAILWGLGQLGKGAVAYVSGFLFGRCGTWKMGKEYSHFSNANYISAFGLSIRDATARFIIGYPLKWGPYQWWEEWFV
ncbi:MAG: hypothetical protein K6E59_05395 [Bacilli bacterium]|nr:hypothetical protein [Bacilli bacterium]